MFYSFILTRLSFIQFELILYRMWDRGLTSFLFFPSFKKILCIYSERGEEREKERERNINVWLPLVCPLLGAWPATQACALTGNRTSNPLVWRLALNPLSHTSQGSITDLWLECLIFLHSVYLLIRWNLCLSFYYSFSICLMSFLSLYSFFTSLFGIE